MVDIVATDEALWYLMDTGNGLRWDRLSTEAEKVTNTTEWKAVFGTYGYDIRNKKYLTRFELRMQMEPGAVCNVFIQYDHDGRWHHVGDIRCRSIYSFLVPVIPKRCDHCQLMLKGKGYMRLVNLSRIL